MDGSVQQPLRDLSCAVGGEFAELFSTLGWQSGRGCADGSCADELFVPTAKNPRGDGVQVILVFALYERPAAATDKMEFGVEALSICDRLLGELR